MPVFLTSRLSVTETPGSAVNASSVYVYQPDRIIVVRRRGITVDMDRSRLFDFDASEIRATARFDVVVPNETAVCRVLGIIPPA